VVSFGYDRHGVVANHAEVLLAPESPDWQEPLHLCLLNERADQAVDALRNDHSVEWVSGTVGVPAREGGVELAIA